MTKKKSSAPFKKGDLVYTGFYERETQIVRKVTRVVKNDEYDSGYAIEVDGGKPCLACSYQGRSVPLLDSGWFRKVK